MEENKICVYAIAKNEAAFVDRWLTSMSEADYIVVLDTGSTDETYSLLKNDSRCTKVVKKNFKKFRFDDARNEALKLVPSDASILVCTDLDEVFEQNWAINLKNKWKEDTNIGCYTYASEHNDLGEPIGEFTVANIHSNGYKWIFPAGERLEKEDKNGVENIINFSDTEIYMHHLPDENKDRRYRLPLLELAIAENPEDPRCKESLAKEYLMNGEYNTAIFEYLACLNYSNISDYIKAECYNRLGDLYVCINEIDKAISHYLKFMELCRDYREPYFCLADIYNMLGLYELAEHTVLAGLRYSTRKLNTIERGNSWISKANDILSISYYYLKDYDKALHNVRIAAHHNPNNIRIISNYNSILLAKYENIVDNNVY